jgi:hypothetical protein
MSYYEATFSVPTKLRREIDESLERRVTVTSRGTQAEIEKEQLAKDRNAPLEQNYLVAPYA